MAPALITFMMISVTKLGLVPILFTAFYVALAGSTISDATVKCEF